jgi:hypothetical protein
MNKGLPRAIFHTKNGILVEVNEHFESLTGFLKEELI